MTFTLTHTTKFSRKLRVAIWRRTKKVLNILRVLHHRNLDSASFEQLWKFAASVPLPPLTMYEESMLLEPEPGWFGEGFGSEIVNEEEGWDVGQDSTMDTDPDGEEQDPTTMSDWSDREVTTALESDPEEEEEELTSELGSDKELEDLELPTFSHLEEQDLGSDPEDDKSWSPGTESSIDDDDRCCDYFDFNNKMDPATIMSMLLNTRHDPELLPATLQVGYRYMLLVTNHLKHLSFGLEVLDKEAERRSAERRRRLVHSPRVTQPRKSRLSQMASVDDPEEELPEDWGSHPAPISTSPLEMDW
ncbi:hypothetical protein CC79DRAFT_1326691 [Sarocladium strictum]